MFINLPNVLGLASVLRIRSKAVNISNPVVALLPSSKDIILALPDSVNKSGSNSASNCLAFCEETLLPFKSKVSESSIKSLFLPLPFIFFLLGSLFLTASLASEDLSTFDLPLGLPFSPLSITIDVGCTLTSIFSKFNY